MAKILKNRFSETNIKNCLKNVFTDFEKKLTIKFQEMSLFSSFQTSQKTKKLKRRRRY